MRDLVRKPSSHAAPRTPGSALSAHDLPVYAAERKWTSTKTIMGMDLFALSSEAGEFDTTTR